MHRVAYELNSPVLIFQCGQDAIAVHHSHVHTRGICTSLFLVVFLSPLCRSPALLLLLLLLLLWSIADCFRKKEMMPMATPTSEIMMFAMNMNLACEVVVGPLVSLLSPR